MMSIQTKSDDGSHRLQEMRAEAYASALYYGECSLQGISSDGATAAEQKARSCQSKWWLPGYDPEHPSQTFGTAPTPMGGISVPISKQACEVMQISETSRSTIASCNIERQDEDDEPTHEIEQDDFDEDEIPFELAETRGPVFARDDDLGSSFGCMRSIQCQSATSFASKECSLPPWLVGRHGALSMSPLSSENRSQATDSTADSTHLTGEVCSIRGLSSHFILTGNKRDIHQVTSESEADETSTTDSKNGVCDDQFRKSCSISLPVQEHLERRTKKRIRILLNDGGIENSALQQSNYLDAINAQIKYIKSDLLSALENDERGTESPFFASALTSLQSLYRAKLKMSGMEPGFECPHDSTTAQYTKNENIDGTWVSISCPTYQSCLGTNSDGEKLFSLGRMSFDIYKPSNLICSIQKQYNTISSVGDRHELPPYVPEYLKKQANGSGNLKTHNIIAAFTIEHPDDIGEETSKEQSIIKKPLKGILTNYGYTLSDPLISDRKSIWFTGGTIEPADNDSESIEEWKKLFSAHAIETSENPTEIRSKIDAEGTEDSETETARDLATKIFLGAISEPMMEDGTIGFHLTKPIGGHGHAYCDILYLDDEIRVMRGHSGSVYVFCREAMDD
eukprot:CAMPEP_0171368190 /NCGR_PEP_ID=MMETSP0879-20121228/6581_1 /TAXON_ID=67004 /ORGANISM="Thalassiosira weissflogii, Strain CCMP1336" /LENGTH=624 /DNA_ID=CAMNT_0011876349 /DNA_START=14 /DNA_END=1888 /DNA_ORIENTATION=-